LICLKSLLPVLCLIQKDFSREEQPMLDVLLLVLGLGLFVISVGYAYACDRL
jgi:hypothetical protein